ncbi:MAG: Wzz/FepE/Etk N-terminal domain-containing protein [Pseudomonadota bacterium]
MDVQKEQSYEDEIDLVSLFLVIWKRRKLIVFGTLGVTLLAAIFSFMIPKSYLSTGFYHLGIGGIPIPSFKNSSTQFYNPERLKFYAEHKTTLNLWEKVSESFKTSEDIKKRIKQIYAQSKEDVREIVNLPSDQKNVVIGVELSYEADLSQKAHDVVSFLGEYVKDCLIYDHLFNYIQNGFNTAELELNKNENSTIDYNFKILQYTKKALDIKAIMTKYSDSNLIMNRQVISGSGWGTSLSGAGRTTGGD